MLISINNFIVAVTRCNFGGPKAPPPVKGPPPAQAASNINNDMLTDGRRRQGAASTILTSGMGVQDQTSKKTILGG